MVLTTVNALQETTMVNVDQELRAKRACLDVVAEVEAVKVAAVEEKVVVVVATKAVPDLNPEISEVVIEVVEAATVAAEEAPVVAQLQLSNERTINPRC